MTLDQAIGRFLKEDLELRASMMRSPWPGPMSRPPASRPRRIC